MSKDAFDQYWDWREKPPGSRLTIPAQVYHSVMSLPEKDQADRQKVNDAVRKSAEARNAGKTVWIYFNSPGAKRLQVGDPDWAKVFASAELADKWLEQNDPEGVAWEYKIERNAASTGAKTNRSVWIYAPASARGSAADPDSVKVFVSRDDGEKWIKKNDPNGLLSEYAVLSRC
ncbi:hypothetical protein [Bradyrhizobium sp. ARR65]|uniref:hypothetical protein n=1 Tax=Bradyrhizobium sp. ARR65 TaxID=1040989 RepID=UPI0005543E6E|nr:hypothetical protein [Bradyrhizobium sp. ARR65]